MAACCTHPLDLTKVRMQTLQTADGSKRLSVINVLRSSVVEQGFFRGLYTGLTASLMRQMSYSLVRLGSYEAIKQRISARGQPSTSQLLLAAAVSGGLGGVAGNPADIVLVRMTSDSTRPAETRFNYRNAPHGLVSLIKGEGAKSLSRGMATNTTRAVLMNTSQVGSYDFFKTTLLQSPVPYVNFQFHDNLLLHTVASCAAGAIATTICAPADVLRSRIMSLSGKASVAEILKNSLREEGPMFLFKGWTPAFIRLGPNTIFLFVFLEQLKRAWVSWSSS